MYETVCLAIVLALMLYLIYRRVDVGVALVAGAVLLGLLFGVAWERFPRGAGAALGGIAAELARAAIKPTSLQLLGLILLIQFLGHTLRHAASLERLIAVLKSLLPGRRAALAVAPAFIGLLPMPGGALFSAPMVGELSKDLDVSSEDRTLINYWFRHVWEWTWPLYPGLLFASAILGAPLGRLIIAQSPMTLGAITLGIVLCLRKVPSPAKDPPIPGGPRELLAATWPVWLVIAVTAFLGVAGRLGAPLGLSTRSGLLVALAVVNPLFLASKRVPWRQVAGLVRQTATPRMVLLVYGVVAFGHMLEAYGAVEALPRAFAAWHVPPLLLLFLVPMVVGVLTGYMPAVVAICFPVLLCYVVHDGEAIDYGRAVLAYAGGLSGVFLSPVHLCLVLSGEYFEADLGRVYRRLIPLVGGLALVAVGCLFLWRAVGLR